MSTIWETWEYHTMKGIKSYVIQLLFHFIVYICKKYIIIVYVLASYNITLTYSVWATLSYETHILSVMMHGVEHHIPSRLYLTNYSLSHICYIFFLNLGYFTKKEKETCMAHVNFFFHILNFGYYMFATC